MKKAIWALPTVLIFGYIVYMQLKMAGPDPDEFRVQIDKIEKREDVLMIFGSVENLTNKDWNSIGIEVEFYDSEGKFIDETSGLGSNLRVLKGYQTENFKLSEPLAFLRIENYSVTKAKVVGGYRY
ncbi:hypothetical protein IEN85_10730 [Pelagicoccus sp. NFK12]|uniref:Uncharacterized protein n=1 Tax=Pelagicoccus enzymogenes TaxID=2773457 RepID=A0A927F7M8_9BACT|nr:hypothetical protein [Pelagicoccus enzymogenes]